MFVHVFTYICKHAFTCDEIKENLAYHYTFFTPVKIVEDSLIVGEGPYVRPRIPEQSKISLVLDEVTYEAYLSPGTLMRGYKCSCAPFEVVLVKINPLSDVNELSMNEFWELLGKFNLAKDFAVSASDSVLNVTSNRVYALMLLRC